MKVTHGHQLGDLLGDGIAHAGDVLEVAPILNHLLNLGGGMLDGAGRLLIGPDLERDFPLELKQVSDILKDFGDSTVFHGFSI
ncbi:hypothetical protein ES703_67744 [subsurface metagenome]